MTDDLPPLLLPATPELLDGWCGPVYARRRPHAAPAGPLIVVDRARRHAYYVAWHRPSMPGTGVAQLHTLSLDLSRAECRDRVAGRLPGLPDGRGGGYAYACVPYRGGAPRSASRFSMITAALVVARLDLDVSVTMAWASDSVPALADLDPNDDRRLPDGSRWVDAAALHAVAMEVICG